MAQIPTSGLVGYFPFTGNANDLSITANNGVVSGATLTTDRFGNVNSAYYFPGSVANKITIPNNPAYNFKDSMTISLWVEFDQAWTYHDESIIYKASTSPYTSGWQISTNQDNSAYGTGNYDIHTDYFTASSANAVSLNTHPNQILDFTAINKWNHYLFVYNGTTANIYLNGVCLDTISVTGNITNNTNDIIVGGALNPVSGAYNRKIDDIRIYNRALNSSEINALYNEGICMQSVTVTDTLVINTNITSYNPITYQSKIKIYPNPSHDKIQIESSAATIADNYHIKIINSLSQVVSQNQLNQTLISIDLSTFTGNGIYFVQLYDVKGNLIDVKKIVLQ